MATRENSPSILEEPSLNRGEIARSLREKLKTKYGINYKNLTIRTLRSKYRKYSSKAGGYIDTRTGAKWDTTYNKALTKEIFQDRSLVGRSNRGLVFGRAGELIQNTLGRIDKFQKAQTARNQLAQHLESQNKGVLQIRNMLSDRDIDTGLTKRQVEFQKKTKRLQGAVQRTENLKLPDTSYKVPGQISKFLGLGRFNVGSNESSADVNYLNKTRNENKVKEHSAEGITENVNTGEIKDETYLPANQPKDKIEPTPGQTDLKINKFDNKNSGTGETWNTDMPVNSSKDPNTGEIKIEKPKHWIRTPLEHELGTDYYNSEAYKRLLRRIEKNKNKKK